MIISRIVLRREIASNFLPFCHSKYSPTNPAAIGATMRNNKDGKNGNDTANATINGISHMNDSLFALAIYDF